MGGDAQDMHVTAAMSFIWNSARSGRGQLTSDSHSVTRSWPAAVSAGGHAGSYRELRRMFDPADPSFHQRERYGGVMLLADAAVGCGQIPDARRVVVGLEAVAALAPSPMLPVHLAYARAVLADDDDASAAYAQLMGLDLTRWPWARARASLAYGRWLGRKGVLTASRQALSIAEEAFCRIGAQTWASQAARELVAPQVGSSPDGRADIG
jgi:hypothetical protein